MCIFFLPSRCPFQHKYSTTNSKPGEPPMDPSRVLSHLVQSPRHTTIGACLNPTNANPFLCRNPVVRHRASDMNPLGNIEDCGEGCKPTVRYQVQELAKTFKSLNDEERKVQERGLMSLADSMMNRKRNQILKKGSCLCERVKDGHNCKGDGKDEGDRYCGLERVESDGEMPGQAAESNVLKGEEAMEKNLVIKVTNPDGEEDVTEEGSRVAFAEGYSQSMYWV